MKELLENNFSPHNAWLEGRLDLGKGDDTPITKKEIEELLDDFSDFFVEKK